MNKLSILIFACCVLTIAATAIVFSTINVMDVKTTGLTLQVKEKYAWNLDADAIHFGGGPPGTVQERKFNLTTTNPTYVSIHVNGDISKYVTVLENDFLLMPGELKRVSIKAKVPEKPTQEWYNGTLIVYFKRWNI
ncbi:MAG: hypothetical protein V1725_02000 [archaeon]